MTTDLTPIQHQGQDALRLRSPHGAQATVLLHGAHLVSWMPAGGEEQLYLSSQANYGPGASVRGGVPVIFPQFNMRGTLPKHGLVRTQTWTLTEHRTQGEQCLAVLQYTPDAACLALWPQAFIAELTFSLSASSLEIELAIQNTGNTPLTFTAALHSYLRINDASTAQIEGLQGTAYEDFLLKTMGEQWGDVLTLPGPGLPIDRIYHDVQRPLVLHELGRRLVISQQGFQDVVVWNPGAEATKTLTDMPNGDWQHMMCIEAACIERPVTLAPGGEWAGVQGLQAG